LLLEREREIERDVVTRGYSHTRQRKKLELPLWDSALFSPLASHSGRNFNFLCLLSDMEKEICRVENEVWQFPSSCLLYFKTATLSNVTKSNKITIRSLLFREVVYFF